jgi:hypothetical protein
MEEANSRPELFWVMRGRLMFLTMSTVYSQRVLFLGPKSNTANFQVVVWYRVVCRLERHP